MYQKYFKRLLDLVFAIILFIIFIPFMIIISIAVHFAVGRPFLPEVRLREGYGKKTFKMYKFRTKIYGWEDKPYQERYTKLTKVIDSTRFNELPQLWNIIKGDMSFVGPRPFNVGETEGMNISKERYLVRPGITGLAQARYGRAGTNAQKIAVDVEYYNNISFWLDFKIILQTPISVIKNFIIIGIMMILK